MSNETQDVTVEPVAEATPEVTQDVIVETPGEEVEAAEVEEVEVDYKAKADKLEKKLASENAKIGRQRAALSQLQKEKQELAQRQAETKPVDSSTNEPNENNYETYDEYEAARVTYFREQGRNEALKESQEQNAKQQAAIKDMEFQQAEQTYRQSNPVYDDAKAEVINHYAVAPVPEAVGSAISDIAERGNGLPELINYFGENGGERLGELEIISRLSPVEAAVEVYKIQQSLSAEPAKAKPAPKPAPIKRVKGSGTINKGLDKDGDVLQQLGLKK